MNFNLVYRLKSKSLWMDVVFYFLCALLIAVVFYYFLFLLKDYYQNQKIEEINKKIAVYGTQEQKNSEAKVFDYKKKIDDFTVIINNHKISSNIFTFIEENTLPTVWFSNFSMSESSNDLRLSGESNNMETLSHQISILENNKDYVSNINILNSQVGTGGTIRFVLNASLNPEIFKSKTVIQSTYSE
ncbi:MAG: hypothetical protein UR31_C0017G0008 [Parcubacteria group bacterium GW2011_GWA2_33_14]|nr:MAG: hypothetical protein UR31_C0017G0008 [Parcubacteria group bacterium GW2011_GWA2_33_14]